MSQPSATGDNTAGYKKATMDDSPNPEAGRMTPIEEQQCIADAQNGSEDGARRLIDAHQDRLHAFVWRMIRDRHEAEEICQDAFLRAFQALDGFDNRYRFSTWLFTIAYRLCLNTMRRRRDFCGDVDLTQTCTTGDADDLYGSDAADAVANTEEARLMRDAIWSSVDELSTPQRATVLLFYRESLSCQEIGDILKMPAATVKSHLHRARARLKELLADRVGDGWVNVRFGMVAEG